MHKQILVWVVIIVAMAAGCLWTINSVGAEIDSPWISSPLSIQKQADTVSVPDSINGNIDCYMEDASNCAVSTGYGTATINNTARLNGSSTYLPVYSYIDSRQHFLPIPNSNTAISYTTEPVYGFYLYFNYNFSSAITKVNNPSPAYQINKPPDRKLADKTNHLLPADYASISFSPNGDWMIVSEPNVAMLRVNLRTFEVLPFAAGFNYTIGIDPNLKTAITNDGRYAVVASKEFNTFKIYDLNTCGLVPDTIIGPVGCQALDLGEYISQQFPEFSFVDQARFLDDDNLSIYANYNDNNRSKTAWFIISSSDAPRGTSYLAVGDSYISGEGAFDYAAGTDAPSNKCHLSLVSYPLLIGSALNFDSYHSIACSGAVTNDILNTSKEYTGQAQSKTVKREQRDKNEVDSILSSFKPGYIDQLDFVTKYQPKAITVSIIGNDVNMIGKLKGCFLPDTCFNTYEDRLEFVREVNSKFSTLVDTYNQIKNAGPPDMKIYAIGYPRIAKPNGNCAVNVHLNNDEVMFTQQALDYLDIMIKTASDKAGVFYVDTNMAFDGHRLCEAGPGSVAMNGVTAGNEIPKRLGGPIGSESFHPNQMGHELLENKILQLTKNLSAPMPEPDLSVSLPAENNLEILNAPHSNRPIKYLEFDKNVSEDLAYQQTPLDITIVGTQHSLMPNTTISAEIHSMPTSLGVFTTNSAGNLEATVTISADVPAGYHTLHFYGTDISGQAIDIYKDIYIARTADDIDGNGIMDIMQACIGIDTSGQDYDNDGIDDACDGNIGLPANQSKLAVTGTVSSQTKVLEVLPIKQSFATSHNFSNASNNQSVLGDNISTQRQAISPAQSDNLRIPNYYFSGAGLAVFIISALAYAVKSWTS